MPRRSESLRELADGYRVTQALHVAVTLGIPDLPARGHDWEDEEAAAILANCVRSLEPGGSVLVVERLVGAPNEDPAPKYSDLNMLVGPGGRERTLEELTALFESAGLALAGATQTRSDRWILEAG